MSVKQKVTVTRTRTKKRKSKKDDPALKVQGGRKRCPHCGKYY